MKRRDFLKATSLASLALSVNGIPIHAFGQDGEHSKTRNSNGKILVLIRLSGGNDGLNTVIPLDRYSELSNARANILIPSTAVLPLSGSSTTGLHPAMTALKNMYNNGKVNIVQGVSYPDPNYSHFRASDIYSSASDASMFLNTGWIGRFIDSQFPGAPSAYPSPTFQDPLSIEIGSVTSSVLVGSQGLNGFTISDIDNFYNITMGTVDPAPLTRGGNELTYVRFIAQQTQAYTVRIQTASLAGSNSVTYPAGNELADQLKIVAKLISGGLNTPVYIVTLNGFDTHSVQVDPANHALGEHANLLGALSDAIGAFQLDLETQNLDNKVTGLTFSEFGRRIISNGSDGTDHGEAAPMIVFGSAVNPSILGTSPVLPSVPTVNDNIPMQHDFRQVYSTILTDWFGMSQTSVNTIMNGTAYQWLPIFATTPLPIRLLSFTADVKHCAVRLQWESSSEVNADHYEVFYSSNGQDFVSVGNAACRGFSSTYTFDHTPKEGMAFYKLKMVDIDMKAGFSQVLSLNISCNDSVVHVYPNPADMALHVDVKGQKGMVLLALVNADGRIVKTVVNQNDSSIIDTSRLPDGYYSLVMTNADGHKEFHKILVKH